MIGLRFAPRLEKSKQHQSSVAAKIRTPFAGTDAELARELTTFKAKHTEQQSDLQRQTDALQAAKATEKRLQQELGDLDRRRATLVVQRQQEQELHDERARHLGRLCERLAVSVAGIDLQQCSAAELQSVQRSVRSAFGRRDAAVAALAEQHDRADATAQTEIDRLRERRAKVESDVMAANRQAALLRQEQSKTQQKIEAVERQAQQLKSLAVDIEKVGTPTIFCLQLNRCIYTR